MKNFIFLVLMIFSLTKSYSQVKDTVNVSKSKWTYPEFGVYVNYAYNKIYLGDYITPSVSITKNNHSIFFGPKLQLLREYFSLIGISHFESTEEYISNRKYGFELSYKLSPKITKKVLNSFFVYNVEYIRILIKQDYFDGSKSTKKHNYITNNIGYGINVSISKRFYIDQNFGIGLMHHTESYKIDDVNKENSFEYENTNIFNDTRFQLLFKVGIGYKFNK